MSHHPTLPQKLLRIGDDRALRREAVTMGFHTCVTLFAALRATTTPPGSRADSSR